MGDPLTLALAFVAGIALGALFFGGLWWTVRRGLASPYPARWFLGSLLLRMSLVLAGLYAIGGDQWQRWLACLLGFLLARVLLLRVTRTPIHRRNSLAKEFHPGPARMVSLSSPTGGEGRGEEASHAP